MGVAIDGKTIAQKILTALTQTVSRLKQQGIIPTLAVIAVGNDPGSASYIAQKQKAAEVIGARVIRQQVEEPLEVNRLAQLIASFNLALTVHGLIVQRPLPGRGENIAQILNSIIPPKDVDGFTPNSPFAAPVAAAVRRILSEIKNQSGGVGDFLPWLRQKQTVIVGRGETAGGPIAAYLTKLNCPTSVVHRQTSLPATLLSMADIIISCVGKERVIKPDVVKPGSILISVGLWRDEYGKLHGDYNEDEIRDMAAFYTPTPGGVGPVNVACLMENLVVAAKSQSGLAGTSAASASASAAPAGKSTPRTAAK